MLSKIEIVINFLLDFQLIGAFFGLLAYYIKLKFENKPQLSKIKLIKEISELKFTNTRATLSRRYLDEEIIRNLSDDIVSINKQDEYKSKYIDLLAIHIFEAISSDFRYYSLLLFNKKFEDNKEILKLTLQDIKDHEDSIYKNTIHLFANQLIDKLDEQYINNLKNILSTIPYPTDESIINDFNKYDVHSFIQQIK